MGIRLDWEIESDQSGRHGATEAPELMRARRRVQIRLLMTIVVLAMILAAVIAVILLRLQESDAMIENTLRDTVEAEVAALRIGDWAAYSSAQRSAGEEWLQRQRAVFEQYQSLKVSNDVQLTGTVRGLTIDGNRARVTVEEIIDGVPYAQLWFYWRYEDGWRHVPPDYTFWGSPGIFEGQELSVRYREVDEPLAFEMGIRTEGWVRSACEQILNCGDLPHIEISILPEDFAQPRWSAENPYRLEVSSPLIARARADQPFSGQFRIDTASAMAERLVEASSPMTGTPPAFSDAAFIKGSATSWLAARFAEVGTDTHLITSIAENYGTQFVGAALSALTPDASVGTLAGVLGLGSIADANLDWRDFLTYRLNLENELRSRGNLDAFNSLYAPSASALANERWQNGSSSTGLVTLVQRQTATDGSPELLAFVRYGEGDAAREESVLFRLIDNTWKRAS